jgi:hypothetical protein
MGDMIAAASEDLQSFRRRHARSESREVRDPTLLCQGLDHRGLANNMVVF